MTPTVVITEVRSLIQDVDTPLRYSDTVLLGFVNQVVKRMVMLRPDLFTVIEDVATDADTVVQSLPVGAVRLSEIFQVVDGDAITEANRETLDQMLPTWRSTTSGTPVNWFRHPRSPTRYFLYPRPTADIEVVAEYVKTPDDYTLAVDIDLPEAYFPALIDGTVFLAESVDNEHIGSGRSREFLELLAQALGADFAQRDTVDSEDANVGQGAPGGRKRRDGGS